MICAVWNILETKLPKISGIQITGRIVALSAVSVARKSKPRRSRYIRGMKFSTWLPPSSGNNSV